MNPACPVGRVDQKLVEYSLIIRKINLLYKNYQST
jgi:hypothetical protein